MLTPFDLALRLTLAAFLGGLLGFEREYKSKPAGLRTHMLVSLGAACFTLATLEMASTAAALTGSASLQMDPGRIIEGVVGGIGFLGAGAILREGKSIAGITTAGSIWLVGAVGVTTAMGSYVLAGLTVALALVILGLVGSLEHRLLGNQHNGNGAPDRKEP